MARNRLLTLTIGPHVMFPTVAQKLPAKLAEGFLQFAPFHASTLNCTHIRVHCQEPLRLSHLTPCGSAAARSAVRCMPLMPIKASSGASPSGLLISTCIPSPWLSASWTKPGASLYSGVDNLRPLAATRDGSQLATSVRETRAHAEPSPVRRQAVASWLGPGPSQL